MRRISIYTGFVAIGLLVLFVCALGAQEYALHEYMPQKVGSTWTMRSTGGRGEEMLTVSVARTMEMDGTQVPLILTQAADGTPRSGLLELVTPEKYTLFGTMFGGRRGGAAAGGGELVTVPYNPPVELPGTLSLGQPVERTTKVRMRDQESDVTVKVELAAIENVSVPKGTFEDCIKIVYFTSFGERTMTRTVWYAKGVGAVKTERPGFGDRPATVTELVDYQLAE